MLPCHPVAAAYSLESYGCTPLAHFNGVPFSVLRAPDLDASDWERHPDTDELLMVLEGSVTVEVLTDSDSRLVPMTAGQFTIVPRGLWHRHTIARDVVELFYMPGSSEQSGAVDPRIDASTRPSRWMPSETPRPGPGDTVARNQI
jgi:mannose-6-phosphate isomerase-like protein (cupin superfamily)